MPVDALPARDRLKETPEVEALCRLPLAFLQAKASAEYREDFERTARPMVEEGRMNPIRYALAAHLDITPAKLSCDPADYPASKFNKLFLDRVVNRFTVEGSEYLTYHEALATGYTGKTVSTTDDSCSLAPCDRPRPARSQHQRCGALAGQARRSRCRFPVDKWSSGLQRLGVYLAQDGRPAPSKRTDGTPPNRSPRRPAGLQPREGRCRKGQERVSPRQESCGGRRKDCDQLSLRPSPDERHGDERHDCGRLLDGSLHV